MRALEDGQPAFLLVTFWSHLARGLANLGGSSRSSGIAKTPINKAPTGVYTLRRLLTIYAKEAFEDRANHQIRTLPRNTLIVPHFAPRGCVALGEPIRSGAAPDALADGPRRRDVGSSISYRRAGGGARVARAFGCAGRWIDDDCLCRSPRSVHLQRITHGAKLLHGEIR
jgi:hypothetical protein